MTDTIAGDMDLILRIVQQDAAALRLLYDRYSRTAFGLAYRVTGDAASAEEIVQDSFVTVWNRASSFSDSRSTNVRGWLLSIVHNRSIDFRRREIDRGPGKAPIESAEIELATPDAWNEVAASLEAEEVRAAMSELPVEQRRIIELSFFEGLSHSEIATQENESLGTVKSRIRLGLKKLSVSLHSRPESAGSAP